MEVILSEVKPCVVADGSYVGKWSGYHVQFETANGSCEAKSSIGVRGINVPCVVTAVGGKLTVEAKAE